MFLLCKDSEEVTEHHLEAVLRILRWQLRNLWLRSDDELDLGDERDDQLAIRSQGLLERVPPGTELRLAHPQHGTDQRLESLGQRGIRDVALVLIELAGSEQALGWYQ